MSDHAVLAPSAAHRWIRCPGSVRLTQGLDDDDESSPYAAEGTFAHEVAARCLREDLDPREMIGFGDGTFEVDAEMADYLRHYTSAVRHHYVTEGGPLHVEVAVKVTENVYGTADAVVVSHDGKTLHVFDLKYGAGVWVPVIGNDQLAIYGVGAMQTLRVVPDEVELHIVQPRAGGDPWRHCRVSSSDLLRWGKEDLAEAERIALSPAAPLNSGDWCRFCRARSTCPALRESALATARAVFDDNEALAAAPPEPGALTVAQIGAALSAFPLLETWMESVRSHAHHLAESGKTVPGWKLVGKTGNRKWRDDEKAVRILTGCDIDPYTKPKVISPAEAERRLPKAVRHVVEDLAMKPEAGTALVPDADPRTAIQRVLPFEVIP